MIFGSNWGFIITSSEGGYEPVIKDERSFVLDIFADAKSIFNSNGHYALLNKEEYD